MLLFFSNIYNYIKLIYKINVFYTLSKTKNIEENDINTFVQNILPTIKNSGCVCIKFCQWITPILDILYNKSNKDVYWLKTLETFYENCPEHSLNFTFNQYKIDFNEEFNTTYELIDLLGSGSIGQVYKIKHRLTNKYYAMKIIHPHVHYEMNLLKQIIYLLTIIPYTKNIIYNILPYDITKFISLFEQQLDMIHESNNLLQMNDTYIDNSMIVIPTLLKCSHNIMIMSYEDGIDIDTSDISDYEKMKIIVLLYLFSRNNFEYKNFNHADLHKGNWKITKDNKLLVYDFGYCFKITNLTIINYIADAFIDTDIDKGSTNLELLCIEVLNATSDSNKQYIKDYIKTNIDITVTSHDPSYIILHLFTLAKLLKIRMPPEIIQGMIIHIQNSKHMDTYGISNKSQQFSDGSNIYRGNYLDYYSICKTYDIFPEIQEYFINTLNEKQVEVDELFDTLDKTSYINNDIKQLLKFD